MQHAENVIYMEKDNSEQELHYFQETKNPKKNLYVIKKCFFFHAETVFPNGKNPVAKLITRLRLTGYI